MTLKRKHHVVVRCFTVQKEEETSLSGKRKQEVQVRA